jgi:hypothetical protein
LRRSRHLDLDQAGGRTLLPQGEAGIGKTALWRAGSDEASARGYRVLARSAAEAETQLAFTTQRDLLADAFDDVQGALGSWTHSGAGIRAEPLARSCAHCLSRRVPFSQPA